MPYRIKLENFEGPLDLLLFLIRKNEVDIYDIPIADITKQYLGYLEIIKILDIEYAGDFLIMAASLIRIKAKTLLPRPKSDDDDEELIDPRMELVTQILEYKRFKEISHKLHDIEGNQLHIYPRSYFDFDFGEEEENEDDLPYGQDLNLFSLVQAFKKVIDRIPKVIYHEIKNIEISTEEQVEYILSKLQHIDRISFVDLLANFTNKIVMVVTFIALLELIKRKQLIVKQAIPYGEIWIKKV